MIEVKDSVRTMGLSPEILFAMMIVADAFREAKQPLVITSITDGKHMTGSLHYAGRAFDIRKPYEDVKSLAHTLQVRLGREYQVLIEAAHIHVEYDPN